MLSDEEIDKRIHSFLLGLSRKEVLKDNLIYWLAAKLDRAYMLRFSSFKHSFLDIEFREALDDADSADGRREGAKFLYVAKAYLEKMKEEAGDDHPANVAAFISLGFAGSRWHLF